MHSSHAHTFTQTHYHICAHSLTDMFSRVCTHTFSTRTHFAGRHFHLRPPPPPSSHWSKGPRCPLDHQLSCPLRPCRRAGPPGSTRCSRRRPPRPPHPPPPLPPRLPPLAPFPPHPPSQRRSQSHQRSLRGHLQGQGTGIGCQASRQPAGHPRPVPPTPYPLTAVRASMHAAATQLQTQLIHTPAVPAALVTLRLPVVAILITARDEQPWGTG